MKQRINLYQSEFEPRLDWLSPGTLAGLSLSLILLMVLTGGGLIWLGQSVGEQLTALDSSNRQLKSTIDRQQRELTQRQPDAQLQQLVTDLQQQVQVQTRLLEELASREEIKTTGFASLLTDLARESRPGLWLDKIQVSESRFVISGQLAEPGDLPAWLAGLANTQSFASRRFDEARVYRQDDQLHFELNAQRQTNDTNAGGRP